MDVSIGLLRKFEGCQVVIRRGADKAELIGELVEVCERADSPLGNDWRLEFSWLVYRLPESDEWLNAESIAYNLSHAGLQAFRADGELILRPYLPVDTLRFCAPGMEPFDIKSRQRV